MNEMQLFSNPDFGDVRGMLIDGEPWFVGKDVAAALGYGEGKSLANAVANHVDETDKGVTDLMTPGGTQKMVIINESGLYALIFGSRLESAKKFKRWVTSEVLPSIRKTGSYGTPKSPLELLELHYAAIKQVNDKVDKVQKDLDDFKLDMPILGVEENRITKAVKKKGLEILGGERSNAYKDSVLRSKTYQDIYRELKRQFGVNTYKAIKRNQCDTAVELISGYTPPYVLAEQIRGCNAQMNMSVN
ncbi:toxin Bro [Clostridium sp. AF27-2AA]|uniref:ORF6C domain-containing protein n=1 Tax=Clostridium sp. AF27-2AA TaxID=2292206 RepID=UPI000E4DF3E2|nr:ORF6C domain-containing protein [Clostridium sp. AF27-2AA]RHQ36299.1 toxin Bro [Clostridium sp. AF27-2AA]